MYIPKADPLSHIFTVFPPHQDARRVLELIASQTPGFIKDKAASDTVRFERHPELMV